MIIVKYFQSRMLVWKLSGDTVQHSTVDKWKKKG
jgi:hypothetical protein